MSNRQRGVVDEFSHMPKQDLQVAIEELQKILEESRRQRNQTQQERDIAERLANYMVEQKKGWMSNVLVKEDEFQENEMEQKLALLNSKQRLVYLEFEKEKNLHELELVAKKMGEQENLIHQEKMQDFNEKKKEIKGRMVAQKSANIREVEKEGENIQRYLTSAQEQFQKNIETYRLKRENGVRNLKKEMELKIRTEVHEIEERKNHHINDLIKNHEKAFKELKAFYNSTTIENLNIIKSQKKELVKLFNKHQENQRQLAKMKGVNSDLKVG